MQMRSKLCRRWGWGVWLALPQAVQAQQLVGLAQMHAADTARVLVSATLVLLMTLPGVALFYAGMVRRKNVLSTLAAVLGTACVVSVVWFAVGYSLALTPGRENRAFTKNPAQRLVLIARLANVLLHAVRVASN